MKDTRTDSEKAASPYFDHWRYDGNRLQQALKVGPKTPIFKKMSETEAKQFALSMQDASDSIEVDLTRQFVQVGDRKAITLHQWMLDFAEGNRNANVASLLDKSSWAFRCVQIRAQAISAIPWALMRGDDEVDEGDLFDLLSEVNPEANWHDLIRATESDLCVFPFAAWLKVGINDEGEGRVEHIQRLNPSPLEVATKDGEIIGLKHGGKVKWAREQIVLFHTYDPLNDVMGTPPLKVAKKPVEVEIEANKHLADFFANKAMPFHVFGVDTTDTNILKRLAREWNREFRGAGSQFKTGFAGGGGKPHELGYAPKELALKEVREEARRSTCGAFGVPPALAGAWEAANYATADAQRLSLYTETVNPEAEYIAGVINAELVPFVQEDLKFQWQFDQLPVMQEDANEKARRLIWAVEAKIIKPEVAAVQMGFEEKDVPEPMPVPSFLEQVPGSDDPDAGTPNAGGKTITDKTNTALSKWKRKSKKHFKKKGKAQVGFNSRYISATLNKQIYEDLKSASTVKAIERIFDDAMVWGSYPAEAVRKTDEPEIDRINRSSDRKTEDEDEMNRSDFLMALAMMNQRQASAPIQFMVDGKDLTLPESKPPEITVEAKVDVPPLDVGPIADAVREGNVSVDAAFKKMGEMMVESGEITREAFANMQITFQKALTELSEQRKAETAVVMPKVAKRHEKQKLTRKQGDLVGSETEVTYEYEDN